MGKFDGILLCSDLDDTLIRADQTVSKENIEAIEYFKNEGGIFTFVTGRVPSGARLIAEYVKPNAPIVVFNGAGIYDIDKDEILWGMYLDDGAKDLVEYVAKRKEGLGLVVCTDDKVYFPMLNYFVDEYYRLENLPLDQTPYREINQKWKKALFVDDAEDIPDIKKLVAASGISETYDFVQSCANYYELLPKGASKGSGLDRLSNLLDITSDKIVAVGDNENDIPMIEFAGTGIAVENAIDELKSAADMVTVSNNEHAIASIIHDIETGKIKI